MTELAFEQITKIITRKVMEQYEQVRQAETCNMFDTNRVARYALYLGSNELAQIYSEHYALIWQNFGKLMRHYGIGQSLKSSPGGAPMPPGA